MTYEEKVSAYKSLISGIFDSPKERIDFYHYAMRDRSLPTVKNALVNYIDSMEVLLSLKQGDKIEYHSIAAEILSWACEEYAGKMLIPEAAYYGLFELSIVLYGTRMSTYKKCAEKAFELTKNNVGKL